MAALAPLLLGAPQALLAQQPAVSPIKAQGTQHSVTLITGDRVILSGAALDSVRIEPGPGRDRVRFVTQRAPVARGQREHLFVVPEGDVSSSPRSREPPGHSVRVEPKKARPRLPLLVVRFTPELDERGRAPSGTRFCLPLYVEQFARPEPVSVNQPSVDVSFDDRGTWSSALVEQSENGWNACLEHPDDAQFVSLRASTRDDSGNAVEQTLIRAYALMQSR